MSGATGLEHLPYWHDADIVRMYCAAGHTVEIRRDRNGGRKVRMNGAKREVTLGVCMSRIDDWFRAGQPARKESVA